jgi:hypothetical protein
VVDRGGTTQRFLGALIAAAGADGMYCRRARADANTRADCRWADRDAPSDPTGA